MAMIYRMMPKVKVFNPMPFGPLDLPLLLVEVHKPSMSDFTIYRGPANPLRLFCVPIVNWATRPGGAYRNKKQGCQHGKKHRPY